MIAFPLLFLVRRRTIFFPLALLACACNPPPPAASRSATTTQIAVQPESSIPDFVVNPIVADSEKDAPPLRIVCLSPTATEICCALGAREWIVGRSDYCNYPKEIAAIPAIGSLFSIRLETLIATKPDLVLFSGNSHAQVEQLAPLKLRIESLPDKTLDDIFTAIRKAGDLIGRPTTASTLCAAIKSDLAAFADRRPAKALRVLIAIEPLPTPPRPVSVAAAGTFFDDLLRRAGHENAVRGDSFFAPLSFEAIIAADPNVILEICGGPRAEITGEADAWRAWSRVGALRAVKEHRVHALIGEELFLPGPRIARVMQRMIDALASENP